MTKEETVTDLGYRQVAVGLGVLDVSFSLHSRGYQIGMSLLHMADCLYLSCQLLRWCCTMGEWRPLWMESYLLRSPLALLPHCLHHHHHQMDWMAEGVCWVWSPPLWERTESLCWEGLPVLQGEGEGLSSSWTLTEPGRAKVGLWVYGCQWTGWTVRYIDRNGGVTEGKTTKYSQPESLR